MTNTPSVIDNSTESFGEEMRVAISDYATYSKDCHDAEKSAVTAAKARLAKAISFEEQKYWYEKMEQHTSKLREQKVEAAAVIIGLLLLCGGLYLYK